jgi:hypothetical protein
MTQLIAALCDGGKTAIAVSDRMVSTSDMTLGFEAPDAKSDIISDRFVVLIAGTIHEPDLVRDVQQKAKGKDRFREIADVFKDLYQELRRNRIEDEILRARLGIQTFDEFHRKQQMLLEGLVIDTQERIARYDLGVQMVIAGVDEHAHIGIVGNPGVWRSYDSLGWCVTGMGDRHAENVFAWYRFSRATPFNQALYITFEAKRKAEMAGGVGRDTDILVVKPDGIHEVSDKTLKALGDIYDERESGTQRKEFDKRIAQFGPEISKRKASGNTVANRQPAVSNAQIEAEPPKVRPAASSRRRPQ